MVNIVHSLKSIVERNKTLKDCRTIISKVRNLTIFNYHQKIDILVRINQCKTNSILIFNFRDNYF